MAPAFEDVFSVLNLIGIVQPVTVCH